MPFQHLGLRAAQRLRTPTLRATFQRRCESNIQTRNPKLPLPGDKLIGPMDNAFNRERAAVKAHATATSGTFNAYPSYMGDSLTSLS